MKSRPAAGRDFKTSVINASKKKNDLRSAALTVAVLVFFVFVLGLAALLRLSLAGLSLAGLTALLVLPRLAAVLTLAGLTTLLILLLHIVCHKNSS
jgi:fucose 4-O-acetylase-like acetyltransferase